MACGRWLAGGVRMCRRRCVRIGRRCDVRRAGVRQMIEWMRPMYGVVPVHGRAPVGIAGDWRIGVRRTELLRGGVPRMRGLGVGLAGG